MKADILRLADEGILKKNEREVFKPTLSNQQLLKQLTDFSGNPIFIVANEYEEDPHAWSGQKVVYHGGAYKYHTNFPVWKYDDRIEELTFDNLNNDPGV